MWRAYEASDRADRPGILVMRMRRHEPTRDYIARRLAEGKTKNEIMRCVKRYIAREIFHALQASSRRTTQLIA